MGALNADLPLRAEHFMAVTQRRQTQPASTYKHPAGRAASLQKNVEYQYNKAMHRIEA